MGILKMKEVKDKDGGLIFCGGRKASYLVGLSSKNNKSSKKCQDRDKVPTIDKSKNR